MRAGTCWSSLPGAWSHLKTLQVLSAHHPIEARAGRRRLPALTSDASWECTTVRGPAIAVLPHHDRLSPSRPPILPSRVLSPLSQPVLYSHVTLISPTVLPGRTPAQRASLGPVLMTGQLEAKVIRGVSVSAAVCSRRDTVGEPCKPEDVARKVMTNGNSDGSLDNPKRVSECRSETVPDRELTM